MNFVLRYKYSKSIKPLTDSPQTGQKGTYIMKIRIKKEDRQWMTLNEAAEARKFMEDLKEEDAAELIMIAAHTWEVKNYDIIRGSCGCRGLGEEVLKVEAGFARNDRLDYNGQHISKSEKKLDVWIEGTVAMQWGFLEISAYLSDIWAVGDEDTRNSLVNHSYARAFIQTS